MADSNFSGQLHSAFSVAPTPPALRPQDPETLTPGYPTYNQAPPYELPGYNANPPLFRGQLPEPHSFHNPYPSNRYHQFPLPAGPRTSGYNAPPNAMFQQGRNGGAASNLTPSQLHGLHMPSSPHPDFSETRSTNNLLPMMDSQFQSSMPSYTSPPPPPWASPSLQEFYRHGNSHIPSAAYPPSGRFGSDAMRPSGENRGPMRRVDSGTAELPRHTTSSGRRALYERQQQQNGQLPGVSLSERRFSALLSSPSRRPDRSISPRTSNRRSFDRYSTDMSQPGNLSEAGDATNTHTHRARRPRVVAPSATAHRQRLFSNHDPNVPTATQMQALKDKLRHLLPNELPEDASTTCDICQKDYSSKHVLPSEEEEVALQLPCKHVFGEHCINTWFDTCRTHKNKLTCPMCRKLLIEPQRPGHSMLHLFSSDEGRRHIFEAVFAGDDRRFFESLAGRGMEGDFANA